MSRAIAFLDRLIGWIAAGALGITFVLLVYNVAARYLISFGWVSPSVQLNWVFEICVFLLVWAVLLGVARIEKRAQHIRVDFLYNSFGPKGQMATEVFALVFAMGVAGFFIYSGHLVVQDALFWDERSETTLRTPFWILYAALPVAFVVHLLFIIERFRLLVTTGESAKQAQFD
ncbi:TRAP transporter small permease [Oceanicola sp. D3]|uniref:TRAP transporter small permease n=1 Tax=Oceanicola sp. D3 TaxID=2587163 RepID=UPI0011231168|nr:TRAP transporter small permease [Oceanicola sp. D3]QDC10635.1 TRAP transporter small permease [Oceanicola sp. D3]